MNKENSMNKEYELPTDGDYPNLEMVLKGRESLLMAMNRHVADFPEFAEAVKEIEANTKQDFVHHNRFISPEEGAVIGCNVLYANTPEKQFLSGGNIFTSFARYLHCNMLGNPPLAPKSDRLVQFADLVCQELLKS